jgi:hypothetical protein
MWLVFCIRTSLVRKAALVILLSGLEFEPIFLFNFALGSLQSPPEAANSGSHAKTQPDEGEPGSCAQLLVQPLATEQPEQDAQGKFEPNSPVGS